MKTGEGVRAEGASVRSSSDNLDETIRPQRLDDFIGQEELRANMRVFLNAARERGQAMDHVLFYGNPGLGKTTLARIMAAELGVNLVTTSGPVLERSGDLAAILTNLSRHDILFVDEIHRMPVSVEEVLYPAMEDFKLDLVIGQGPAARTVKLDIEPFTLVGATTRLGLLSSPLRDRFGIVNRLEFYTPEELARVVMRAARILNVPVTEDGALEIGRRSRGMLFPVWMSMSAVWTRWIARYLLCLSSISTAARWESRLWLWPARKKCAHWKTSTSRILSSAVF